MSCVNKASLQFKDCCKRLDLSEQQLEQIIYDYTNQLGNENTFPTDTYIEQLLRGIPTSELSDSQRELYKLKYEEAQPLDTFELTQLRVLELQQYYPDDRIRIIQRNNSKYQVVVNTDNVNTFSREYNSILGSRRDTITRQGIQDIKDIFGESLFGLNDGISLDQAISALQKNPKLVPLTNMLKFLKNNTNIEVIIKHQDKVFNEEGIEVDGLFKGDTNTIILSENTSKPIGQVLTHEILHSLFIDRLNKNPRIRKKLLTIIDNAKYALGEEANSIYGLTGTDEFISELFTDGRLIKALYNIKGDLRTPTNNILSAIYNWVKDCLKLIFKGHPTLYDNALHEVERLFSDENEYSEQGFIKAQNEVKALLSTIRTPDYKYAEDQLLAIIADYPQLFNNINPKDFLKKEKYSENYRVIYENGNRHLFVNRNTANVKLKQLRSREYSLVIGEKGAKNIDTLEEVTTRIDALHTAIEMEKSKKSPLIIKAATGWERGADGKWRYEIEDLLLLDSISLKLSNYTILDYQYHDYEEDQFYSKEDFKDMLNKGYEPDPWTKREYIPQTFKITNIVKQNEAFNELTKTYPILKDLNIIISSYNGSGLVAMTSGIAIGNYNSLTNTLTINQDRDPKRFLSTLIHEIQHFIQNEEGFAYGANVSQFKNHPDVIKQKKVRDKALKKLKEAFKKREAGKITLDEYFDIYDELQEAEEKLNNLPYELYKRVAGEAEARTAERRRELSIEEKRASLFTEDMYKDVAKEDLIFLQQLAEESLSLDTESTNQTEEFYTKQSANDYVNDLIAVDNIKREDIKVEHFPETENTDEYWIVSYTIQLPTEQSIPQQPILEEQQKINILTQDLGGGEEAASEIKDAVKVAKKGLSFELVLAGLESFFSKEEQALIKQGLNGRNLLVMSVSRLTDPAFFSKEIVSFLERNAEKSLSDPTRITAIEIWSKHDGLPIKDILDACKKYRVAPMVSFSITGLGGTALEGGVMKYQDMLEKVGELIKNGTLNPTTTTVRIDPILPGVTNMEDIKKIVETAKSFGIKKFVTSLVQSYGYTEGTPRDRKVIAGINNALATEGRVYNWDEYYGRDRNGKINFKPKQKYIDEIGEVLLKLDEDPEITIQTCAFGIKGLKVSACLDPMIIERITGIDILRKDGTYDRDTSRPECMCYGCHNDFFKGLNKKCFSSCAYCYAAHSGDNKLNYYNDDGTLKDNDYTRTNRDNVVQYTSQPLEEQPQEPSYEERLFAISEQVSNLINNDRGLKATELRQLSELMVYWMSEFISDCLDNPELVFQVLKITDYSNSDIEKISLMSRKSIVLTIGVENMFNLCKSWVLTPDPDRTGKGNANINTHRLKLLADLLKKNFQGLMQFSTSVWSTLEDFSIGLTETGYDTLETSNPDAFLDEELIKERDKQADGESTLESWQVESNTIDALTTATQLVKRELLHCYLYENTGEVDDLGKPIKRIKTNKFGINERLNPREAINAIIKWVLGCWDLNSMVAALKEHQDKNPWVEQLVNKLSDIKGNESDFQSQFFSCMCRSFQLYGVVNENDKRELYQHSINKNPMLLMAFNGIKDLYKVGEHPLLKLDGIDRKAFKEFHEDIEQLINYSKLKYSEILNIDELNNLISHVYMLLGYYDATPEIVGAAMSDMTFKTLMQNLLTLRTYLDNEKLNKLYNPFDFNGNNSIILVLLNVLRPITYIMDDYAVTQFFESGNMRQSNVIPSFMTKLFSKMQLPLKEFEEFVEKEYGLFDWFYDKKLKKYKNEWLSRLVRMPEEERKKLFEHKVQLSFNKKQYMRGMTDSEYAVSVISEYFTAGKLTAWYKVPIMSNKPTSEFIKFIKYDDSDYKDRIVVGMLHIFVLELGRIQTIIKRQNAGINKSDPRFIKNFDKNGAKFCFLDFLNPFLNESKSTELGQLLNIKINGTRELSTEENARLNDLVKQEIRNSMEARVQQIMESWRQQGILTAVSLIQGFERKPEKAEGNWESAANNAKIENFIWNDTFAAMEILLLTITDVAQYKDAEDLQKRLAQIHAPGVRGNIQARDYFGNQVSDGTHRAVYLTDFDDFISNVIDNVTKVFDKKIAEAPENEKAQWKSLKESLVGKDGAYRQINVADALAYACPTSYRKKAYMFGKWSREKERMYQLLMSGQYDFSTLKQAFGEPLKPFLYSYEEVDAGVENSPIETFKIGVQNKDSEYLLIMADALTRNEDTGIPNILRAIYDVMEESHKVKNENGRYIAATDGIDDIQFESTVKAGLYGRINLKQFSTDSQGETNARNELRSKIFDGLGGYNSTYIHETRYEDYCIQQEVPEHFKDHSQAHGSQIRYIIPSDLPSTDASGETVVYSYFDPATGTERKLDAKQFKAEYENHCATNIQESLDLLKEEFGLVTPDGQISFDRKQMNQTLSEILKREILSSPRYGIDMLLACSLNADGEFNIPLGDPIQSRRIEQLINSIIKNRINKQKIAGGPVVQVTTFGTSRDLNIRFKSNKGGLLMTRKEFKKSKEEGTYEEYIEKYLDGIAYYEIYAPMYTNELFQQFADRDGNIDIKRIEKENPELLKIIGYRIPTEDKYSCFPAKIVGFLPREAGDAVMLPADITAITGSDFDVDKMYLMRKEFKEEKKSKEEITKELEDMLLEGLTGKAKKDFLEAIKRFMDLSEGKRDTSNDFSNPIVKAYANMSKKRFVEYTEGRQYHNNMIIDMSYSVLTNKEVAYQVLNPGGFDLLKRMGYAIAAYKDPEVRSKYSFEQLMEMSIDKGEVNLKSLCYKNKNLAFFDTQVQFYKQNSAAGMILGMFAVLKIAHAVLESDGFGIDLGKVFIDKNTNEQIPFGFCGIPFLGIVEVDKRFDANNQLIGKTLGSLVASAADAVKDPVLNLNNINNQTANVLTTMLRLGIVYEDAALLLSLPAITKILQEHSKRMVNKEFISLNALIKSRMLELDDKYYMSESEKIQSEPLNREDLIRGFSESDVVEAEKLEWKVLNAYLKFDQMSLIIKGLTNATRYNSVSNAVGPLIIDNLIMEYKAGKFSDAITYQGVEAKSINSVFNIHPILDKFSLATIIARRLLGEMPAYSSDFRILVNNSGDYTLSKIMGDRKLFSKLSDFYQSYLLVQSGFINPKDREYYTDKFPVEFMKYKEQYSDNPFVQAIRLSTGTFGGKTKGILTLDSVGMEQMQKDRLSSGWADLYKENPELAKKLFIYNFFKGGLGFSPKTFMNLVPISMKESIENNGIKYVDVFRHIPSLGNYSMIFDLFVGNNVGDFKLVPQRNPYSEHQNILGNKIIITNKFENYELDYFKTKGFNNIYRIFKLLQVDPITKRKVFVEIPVLGNQGEFFAVSATPINKSNVTNTNTLEEEGFEPLDEEIVTEEGYDPYYTKIAIDIIKNEKGLKDTKEAYETLKSSRKTLEGLSEQEAEQRKAKIREAVMNSLKRRNITFNEEELNKTTNEFC